MKQFIPTTSNYLNYFFMITKNFSVKDLANTKYVRGNRSQLFGLILVVQEGNTGCHSIRKCLCFAISKQKKVRALKCHKCLDLRNCFIQCEDMGCILFLCPVSSRFTVVWSFNFYLFFFFFAEITIWVLIISAGIFFLPIICCNPSIMSFAKDLRWIFDDFMEVKWKDTIF